MDHSKQWSCSFCGTLIPRANDPSPLSNLPDVSPSKRCATAKIPDDDFDGKDDTSINTSATPCNVQESSSSTDTNSSPTSACTSSTPTRIVGSESSAHNGCRPAAVTTLEASLVQACPSCHAPTRLTFEGQSLQAYIQAQNRLSTQGLSECNPMLTELLFEYLPMRALWTCRAVCRAWCALSPASRDPRNTSRIFLWGERMDPAEQCLSVDTELASSGLTPLTPSDASSAVAHKVHFARFWMSGHCFGIGDVIFVKGATADEEDSQLGKIVSLFASGATAMSTYREQLVQQHAAYGAEQGRHRRCKYSFPWVASGSWMQRGPFYRRDEIPEQHQRLVRSKQGRRTSSKLQFPMPGPPNAKAEFRWLVSEDAIFFSEVFEGVGPSVELHDPEPVTAVEALCSVRTFRGFLESCAARDDFQLFLPRDVRVIGDHFGKCLASLQHATTHPLEFGRGCILFARRTYDPATGNFARIDKKHRRSQKNRTFAVPRVPPKYPRVGANFQLDLCQVPPCNRVFSGRPPCAVVWDPSPHAQVLSGLRDQTTAIGSSSPSWLRHGAHSTTSGIDTMTGAPAPFDPMSSTCSSSLSSSSSAMAQPLWSAPPISVEGEPVVGVPKLSWSELAAAVVDIVCLRSFWRPDAILEALYNVALQPLTNEETAPANMVIDQSRTADDITKHFAQMAQNALESKETQNAFESKERDENTGDHVAATSSERLQRAMNWILHGKEEGSNVEDENDSNHVEEADSAHSASPRRNRRRPACAGGVTSIGRNRSAATPLGGSAAAKARSSQAADSVFSRAWALRRLLVAGTSWQDVEDAVLNSHTPRPTPSGSGSPGRNEANATGPSVVLQQAVGCKSVSDAADRPHVVLKDACTLCGFGGILVCCDGVCRRDFHPGCLGLQAMPSDKVWECVFCKHTRLRQEADAAKVSELRTEGAGQSPHGSVNRQHGTSTKGSGVARSIVAIDIHETRKRRKRRSGRTICHRGCGRPPHRGSCPRRPVDPNERSRPDGRQTGPLPRKRTRATKQSSEPRICHRGCGKAPHKGGCPGWAARKRNEMPKLPLGFAPKSESEKRKQRLAKKAAAERRRRQRIKQEQMAFTTGK